MKNAFVTFPIALYANTIKQRAAEKEQALKEKAIWQKVRNGLSIEKQRKLDDQFNDCFNALYEVTSFFCQELGPADWYDNLCNQLIQLVKQGASAILLDNYELGNYNLPSFVKDITINLNLTNQQLALTIEMIRYTIMANADILHQKAYVGNGGAPLLFWLNTYLFCDRPNINSRDRLLNSKVVDCTIYYEIFCCLLAYAPDAVIKDTAPLYDLRLLRKENVHCPYETTVACYFSIVQCLQTLSKDEYCKRINNAYFFKDEEGNPSNDCHFFTSTIKQIIKEDICELWLPILFPFPNDSITNYIDYKKYCVQQEDPRKILDAFKVSKSSRRSFQHYFSAGKHWFLLYIIASYPESIFKLVHNAEAELLFTFCKSYASEIRTLRDKNNKSLLDIALSLGNPSEKIITKLKSMHVPFSGKQA